MLFGSLATMKHSPSSLRRARNNRSDESSWRSCNSNCTTTHAQHVLNMNPRDKGRRSTQDVFICQLQMDEINNPGDVYIQFKPSVSTQPQRSRITQDDVVLRLEIPQLPHSRNLTQCRTVAFQQHIRIIGVATHLSANNALPSVRCRKLQDIY